MNQRPQQRPATTPAARPATTPPDVARLANELTDVMGALLGVVEQETELVRAGKVREGMRLEAQKSELSRRYMMAVEHLKSMQKMLSQTEPELLATLRRHHETFRAMLQVNLTVLATAHAVSEGIVRGVNAEVQRRNVPNTYTAAGRRAVPGPRNMTPIAVSRSL
ncbi:hypothetical protein MTX26_23135 [Bradyrhizobium sp. ISRA443]|uniref:hypothetical protein n=1 Tax=unclassified Bradyrhizobium TaxID=2631580 RepID=UPI002479C4B9|nr:MULTISPECIES: hypothetical protein [unclassified Bradyrhizobium]WGR92837.1 hypothetical protein MTX20_33975 [Bradyrhizobium sp. ISRA435]WGR97313.1 hypothetical protein MTX23_23135 [Bradyrhizobium sp. ISRA436]WGS04202.1 hypothetical protein MTX18_23135 [Bradyrhizobium sp. ISRA437]WGS11085.1 hypothetical protein MTX26_23135 [Bradyrhizobium sp. ISRA443]